jgi:hypothetical protein
VAHAFNPSTREAEAGGFLNSRPALVYKVNSRTARDTQRNPVSKNKTKQNKTKQNKTKQNKTIQLFHLCVSNGCCMLDTLLHSEFYVLNKMDP